jgi:hypothetical protein
MQCPTTLWIAQSTRSVPSGILADMIDTTETIGTLSTRASVVYDGLPSGPFRRITMIRSGIHERHLIELLRAGLLRIPVTGVLTRADAPDDLADRAAAVRLVLPDGAALCRVSAAWLHGIDARPPGVHDLEPPLQCAVPLGITPVRRPGSSCYIADLRDEDLCEVAGIRCTNAARTAIDLARWSKPGMGLGTLDAMARAGLVDPADLLVRVERWRGDRFVAQARRLIALCDPLAESQGESWLRLRFHDAGFPPPDLQISLIDQDGVEVYRLDLGYPKLRYSWEYDGEAFHFGLVAEAADRRRRADIADRWGWTVIGLGKNLVLGPSMALEYGVGEVLGMQPALRRRQW